MVDKSILREGTLFAGIPDHELAQIEGCMVRRVFARGVFVFHKDSPGQTLYVIESGRVRTFVLSEAGQEISLAVYGPGEFFGELSVLDGQPRSTGAVTLEAAVLLVLHRDDFLHLMQTSQQVAFNLMQTLAGRVRYSIGQIQNLAFLDVNGRVAARLLELAGQPEIRMTQVELASWVAASRESVNKVIAGFRSQGLIDVVGNRITILDRRGLLRHISY